MERIPEVPMQWAELITSRRQFNALPKDQQQEILSQVNIASAIMAALASGRIDRATKQPVSPEEALATVNTCAATLDRYGLTNLGHHLTLATDIATTIEDGTETARSKKVASELHRIKESFMSGEGPGDKGTPPGAASAGHLMNQLKNKIRYRKPEQLTASEKEKIVADIAAIRDQLSPAQLTELYGAARFASPVEGRGMEAFDAFHDSVILSSGFLALAAATTPIGPLALGVSIGALAVKIKDAIMPENPSQAFDAQLPLPRPRIETDNLWTSIRDQQGADGGLSI